jgi:2-isopropylmalate synthase
LNLFSQGVDPQLDFHNVEEIKDLAELCTGLPVHPRHPYAGELVFTAFSGSHQDAISKGMHQQSKGELWEVPYIPLDPADIGRHYDAIVRINSQSGKGGVAYVLETEYGIEMPKPMHPEFAEVVQALSEKSGAEVLPSTIMQAFEEEYLLRQAPMKLVKFQSKVAEGQSSTEVTLEITWNNVESQLTGVGTGPIDAAVAAFSALEPGLVKVLFFSQHSCTAGADARAVSFIKIEDTSGNQAYGVGIDSSTSLSSIQALISAINRLRRR